MSASQRRGGLTTPHRQSETCDEPFCLRCGYRLRDLTTNRCPECGRAFDPSDPRTVSLGRPLRSWQRWLLRPIGWRTIALPLIATAGLIYLSWPPRITIVPWMVLSSELAWPFVVVINTVRWHAPHHRPTIPDAVFYGTVTAWVLFVLWILWWRLLRLAVPRQARRSNVWDIDVRPRRRVMVAAASVSVCCMLVGWKARVGRRWIARANVALQQPSTTWPPRPVYWWESPPVALSSDQERAVLLEVLRNTASPNDRLAAIKFLVEGGGQKALADLHAVAEKEPNPDVLAWDLRLIGLYRDPRFAPFLISNLNRPEPQVRAAAADALGILRHPNYSIAVHEDYYSPWQALSLDSTPPIDAEQIIAPLPNVDGQWPQRVKSHDLVNDPAIGIDQSVKGKLLAMMSNGSTLQERQAAARALVGWPPAGYQLRFAEWGVWMDHRGHMALVKSILDEIPPFVHRTGNPISDFSDYFLYPTQVFKPIVHLTSNMPLAADISINIADGRPWFAFPRPDDFAIGTEPQSRQSRGLGGFGWLAGTLPNRPDDFSAPQLKALDDRREGYPWLVPHHRLHYADTQGNASIWNLGLHWQSVIVCPERASWMRPPDVPADPRFAWWRRLRDVQSSWISSRGEAERFLYYDGPTRAAVPISVSLDEPLGLHFTKAPVNAVIPGQSGEQGQSGTSADSVAREGLPDHEGLYIQVKSGQIGGMYLDRISSAAVAVPGQLPLRDEAVIDCLRQMLTRYGLTESEAEGLISAWTPQFFHSEGRRFVLRMSPAECSRQCPLEIRPTPTQVVRLGLILTEFDSPESK